MDNKTYDPLYTIHDIGKTRSVLPDGSLECRDVPIARCGDLEYKIDEPFIRNENLSQAKPNENGSILINRPSKELFNEKTISSFECKPITLMHPRTLSGLVTPETYKMLTCGVTRNVRQDGDYLVADLVIQDRQAIEKVLRGELKEISIGYAYKLVFDDSLNQYLQVDIVGNHVAIVDFGRSGRQCVIGDSKPKEVNDMADEKVIEELRKGQEELKKQHEELKKQNADILELIKKEIGTDRRGRDSRGRDESEEKRHEDEVRGGEKANAELEGEHREEKKMRNDDRKGRDTRGCDDERYEAERGSVDERIDHLDHKLTMIAEKLGIKDAFRDDKRKADDRAKDSRGRDEDKEERHRDDVRGGEVAEGEYREKHGEGEPFDDDGRMRDRARDKARDKCHDKKGRDADEDVGADDEEEEAIQVTIDEAEEIDPSEINISLDRAYNKVTQDAAFVGHHIIPEMTVSFAFDSSKKMKAQRNSLDWYRRAIVAKAFQNSAYSGVISRATDSKPLNSFTHKDYSRAYFELSKRLRRANNVVIRMVGQDTASTVMSKFNTQEKQAFTTDFLRKQSAEFWKKG